LILRVAAPSRFFEGTVGLVFRMSLLAIGTEEKSKPRPFKPEWVGHPEKLNQSHSVDVLEWCHPNVISRQEENWERQGHCMIQAILQESEVIRGITMIFNHPEIKTLNPCTRDGLRSLLEHLCGEPIKVGCTNQVAVDCGHCQACMNWGVLSERLKLNNLKMEDLNDILILVDQSPISEAFFKMFLSRAKSEITFEELKSGVAIFEGFAVLLFGNVRFAYRSLKNLGMASLEDQIQGLHRLASRIIEEDFKPRRKALPLPMDINKKSTWLLGYIAKNKADRDIAMYAAMAELLGLEREDAFLGGKNEAQKELYAQFMHRLNSDGKWRQMYSNFDTLRSQINLLQGEIRESRRRGCLNTAHYLALDYLDVYVATSMRERWEFEDVHTTAAKIFSDSCLEKLNLRFFDPTQSFLENRVDKGLVEALMLKRARCTIYMAQETDTFGKDSELATTLAQGKPVIVFVPEIIVAEYADLASRRPLAYLQRRLPQLLAEDRVRANHVSAVLRFLQETASFDPYFQVVGEEEKLFLDENRLNERKWEMCQILAEAEKDLFDGRAKSLQKSHPLALQVHLETGVANGVLVVRSVPNCAELLEKLLTNSCEFTFDSRRENGILCLVEKVSDSPFRVVTQNSTVSNAFWSRYLSEDRRPGR
jgi:hypothetical protein